LKFSHFLPLLFFIALPPVSRALTEVQYVIAISIDGGRGDYIQNFIETAPTEFPNFTRLRDMSAYTYKARCDYTESITIPDHLCMLTGRPVRQPAGLPATLPHGVISDAPLANETIHNSGLNNGVYKESVFDVVHDRGLSTALYMGKTRLTICDRSWDATNGALDTIGADNGRDKIDLGMIVEASGSFTPTAGMITNFTAAIQAGTLKNFTIFQIADTDYAGHADGWRVAVGSTYRNTMKVADGWLGQILDAVQSNAALAGKVAIMLTADHGGSSNGTHTDFTLQGNYTIPFFLSAPGITGGSNLYAWLENRADAGAARPSYVAASQPVRNGDVANFATALLGLPAVPGSLMIPEFVKPVNVARNGQDLTVVWPAYLTGWTLESTGDLVSDPWKAVTTGLTDPDGQHVHTESLSISGNRFFRLRRPASAPENAPALPARKARRAVRKG
jgi:hypothetical protein